MVSGQKFRAAKQKAYLTIGVLFLATAISAAAVIAWYELGANFMSSNAQADQTDYSQEELANGLVSTIAYFREELAKDQ